eukprot:m51a1_g1155 hypothetical protein (502) ;mRNA; r:305955-307460
MPSGRELSPKSPGSEPVEPPEEPAAQEDGVAEQETPRDHDGATESSDPAEPLTSPAAVAAVGAQAAEEEQRSYWGRCVYLAVIYMAIHIPWSVAWSFATTLVPGTLSYVSMGLLHVSMASVSVLSILFLEKFGVRVSIAVSAAGFAAYSGVTATKSGWAMVAVSPALGASQSLFFNSQSSYVTKCGTKRTMGRILGLFWTIANTGFLIGNLLTGLLTRFNVPLRTTFVCCAVSIAAPLVMLVFVRPFPSTTVGSARPGQKRTLGDQLRRLVGVLSMLKQRRVLLVLPAMIMMGCLPPFYAGRLNPILGPQLAGLVWTANYVLKVSIQFGGGLLADLIDRRIVVGFSWLAYTVSLTSVCFFDPVARPWLCYVAYLCLALGEASIWSGALAPTLSCAFGDVEGAYSIYRMVWPIFTAVTMFVTPFVSVRLWAIIMLALVAVMAVCYVILVTEDIKSGVLPSRKKTSVPMATTVELQDVTLEKPAEQQEQQPDGTAIITTESKR